MYAVIFDVDTNCVANEHNEHSGTDAYGDIRKFMEVNGFNWQQGGVYFGESNITAVKCVVTVQKLAKIYPWFSACAKDIRMLRIEDNSDLREAINF